MGPTINPERTTSTITILLIGATYTRYETNCVLRTERHPEHPLRQSPYFFSDKKSQKHVWSIDYTSTCVATSSARERVHTWLLVCIHHGAVLVRKVFIYIHLREERDGSLHDIMRIYVCTR